MSRMALWVAAVIAYALSCRSNRPRPSRSSSHARHRRGGMPNCFATAAGVVGFSLSLQNRWCSRAAPRPAETTGARRSSPTSSLVRIFRSSAPLTQVTETQEGNDGDDSVPAAKTCEAGSNPGPNHRRANPCVAAKSARTTTVAIGQNPLFIPPTSARERLSP